jgi:hypothetical protein
MCVYTTSYTQNIPEVRTRRYFAVSSAYLFFTAFLPCLQSINSINCELICFGNGTSYWANDIAEYLSNSLTATSPMSRIDYFCLFLIIWYYWLRSTLPRQWLNKDRSSTLLFRHYFSMYRRTHLTVWSPAVPFATKEILISWHRYSAIAGQLETPRYWLSEIRFPWGRFGGSHQRHYFRLVEYLFCFSINDYLRQDLLGSRWSGIDRIRAEGYYIIVDGLIVYSYSGCSTVCGIWSNGRFDHQLKYCWTVKTE